MRGRLSLATRIALVYLLPVIAIGALAIYVTQGLRTTVSTADRITETQEIIGTARLLERLLIDAESSLRGFLITGDEDLLDPYNVAVFRFERTVATLARQVAEQPAQRRRAALARELFERWRRTVASDQIEARRLGRDVAAMVSTREGKGIVDAFRDVMRDLLDQAESRLEAQIADSQQGFHRLETIAWVWLAAAVSVTAGVGALLLLGLSRSVHDLTDSARRIADGELDRRMTVRGDRDLSAMAEAFNRMAERLQATVQQQQRTQAELRERVERLVALRTRESNLLTRMGELLQAADGREEAYRVIAQTARELFPDDSGALLMLTGDQDVEMLRSWGRHGDRLGAPVFTARECWALRRGKTHTGSGEESDLRCGHVDPAHPAPYICIPLIAQGETLGVLHLRNEQERPEGTLDWSDAEHQLAATMAEHIALALANLELRHRLQEQSLRDPLTGLYNRRMLDDALPRELRRSARSQQPVALLLFDLDHFKQLNDEFGHDAGDAVLRRTAELLQERFRSEDICCRFGGEEFAVVLPGTGVGEAGQRAEELRRAMAAEPLVHQGTALGSVTLSLGIAVAPDDAQDAERLIQSADEALYAAKDAGRNRVTLASDVP